MRAAAPDTSAAPVSDRTCPAAMGRRAETEQYCVSLSAENSGTSWAPAGQRPLPWSSSPRSPDRPKAFPATRSNRVRRSAMQSFHVWKVCESWPENHLIGCEQCLRILRKRAFVEIAQSKVQFFWTGIAIERMPIHIANLGRIVRVRLHAFHQIRRALLHERAVHNEQLLQRRRRQIALRRGHSGIGKIVKREHSIPVSYTHL